MNIELDGDKLLDKESAALLIPVIGITNTFGHLFFGWISDRINKKGTIGGYRMLNAFYLIFLILFEPIFNTYVFGNIDPMTILIVVNLMIGLTFEMTKAPEVRL